jgi:hypothetical protein
MGAVTSTMAGLGSLAPLIGTQVEALLSWPDAPLSTG